MERGGNREHHERTQLTEAMRPVEEAAVTARLDCRKAFLNMMDRGEAGFREREEGIKTRWIGGKGKGRKEGERERKKRERENCG